MRLYRILFLGDQAFGGDARGLAFAFRRLGNIVQAVDPRYYIPTATNLAGRIVNRLCRPVHVSAFNRAVLEYDLQLASDVVVVFKGASLKPDTLLALKERGRCLVQFYPDVSLHTHGKQIPRCVPIYDVFFTTKSFGIKDLESQFNMTRCHFLPHGFDPDVHRPRIACEGLKASLTCDVCFIGTWSPRKERLLAELSRQLPDVRLRIWGNQWQKATDPVLKTRIEFRPAEGEMYALAISHARITLGLLSERRRGASSGDLTTSRTFNIPACGGFMLHQRTDEVLNYFSEGKHIACFSDSAEMIEKIRYYLDNPDERELIRKQGCSRCQEVGSIDCRAQNMLKTIESHLRSRHSATPS